MTVDDGSLSTSVRPFSGGTSFTPKVSELGEAIVPDEGKFDTRTGLVIAALIGGLFLLRKKKF